MIVWSYTSREKAAQMAKRIKVKAENLQAAVEEVLSQYGDEIDADMLTAVKEVAKKGRSALRNESNETFDPKHKPSKGRYGTGWTYWLDRKAEKPAAILYNRKYPGLPHLLEHGHATRNGGRNALPHQHIEPVETELVSDFVNDLLARFR